MNRRSFLASGLGAAAVTGTSAWAGASRPTPRAPFKLKYAPHFGMFRHHAKDLVDQVKFMADQGFRALEDNGMKGKSVADQERIRAEMDRHGMEMGVFVAMASFRKPEFVSGKKDDRERILKEIRGSVEVAKRMRAKWMTVVPGGFDQGLEPDYQTANCVETLKYAADILEPHGLTMVLEPLNPWTNHAGVFLTKVPQAYLICRGVGSPACKILFDIYHQQITEGNLIPNMRKAWSEIGYFQIGDNPGRKEPTTGEINYRHIFRWLHGRKWDGILGMEHGNSKPGAEGEKAVIAAYRHCDDFATD